MISKEFLRANRQLWCDEVVKLKHQHKIISEVWWGIFNAGWSILLFGNISVMSVFLCQLIQNIGMIVCSYIYTNHMTDIYRARYLVNWLPVLLYALGSFWVVREGTHLLYPIFTFIYVLCLVFDGSLSTTISNIAFTSSAQRDKYARDSNRNAAVGSILGVSLGIAIDSIFTMTDTFVLFGVTFLTFLEAAYEHYMYGLYDLHISSKDIIEMQNQQKESKYAS